MAGEARRRSAAESSAFREEERRSPRDRRRARAWALQTLYLRESAPPGRSLLDLFDEVVATRRVAPGRRPHARRILAEIDAHGPEIDGEIQDCLDNWRLERLSVVDRAVLRIGAAELLYVEDIPPKVAIQEAIRIAEQYGGNDSPRFVNGVLDALHRRSIARLG